MTSLFNNFFCKNLLIFFKASIILLNICILSKLFWFIRLEKRALYDIINSIIK